MNSRSKKQRDKKFAEIGEFIFCFSQLEFSIRIRLGEMLNIDDKYFDIVTSRYDFAMLCSVTKDIMLLKYPEAKKQIVKVFGACYDINAERKRIAHGTWAEGEEGLASRHVPREKISAAWYYDNVEELQKQIRKAQQTMIDVLHLPEPRSQRQGGVTMVAAEIVMNDEP